jgi:hypothetical protein
VGFWGLISNSEEKLELLVPLDKDQEDIDFSKSNKRNSQDITPLQGSFSGVFQGASVP